MHFSSEPVGCLEFLLAIEQTMTYAMLPFLDGVDDGDLAIVGCL